jgi:tetratricopeptide (TPR) repeat protein
LDDLEKFAGRFGLDELIAVLRKNSKELKVLATCRTGKEFDQAFGQKEMEILLSQCQSNKVEPRILDQKEEKELVKGIGKSWEDVTSDGTPGSIVLGLDQMGKRYKDLEDEPKTILHILKLLKEARIYTWTEELVKNIAKSKIFELKGERYQWDNWLKILQENGFIQKSDSKINISHDSYLDNKFITDYSISDSILIELKDELVALKDAENLFYLGLGFDNRKNLNEAIVCYQKSIGINPNFHMAHTNLGALLYDLKRYPEAEKEYREAIRINPYDFVAHNNIGNLLYYFKRTLEAEKELKESIRINPLFAQSHNNLGNVFCDLKRYAEAEREYREALKINPDLDVAHYNLGHLFNSLIKYNEAEKEYREAIVINSSNIEARLNLSNVLYDLKRYSEAEKEYRETIRINPDSAEAHNNLGNLHKDLKIFTEAEKEYKEAIRINPDYAEAYGNLGLLYIEMEKKEEAKKELQKAKELFKKQDKEEDVKKVEDILKGLE